MTRLRLAAVLCAVVGVAGCGGDRVGAGGGGTPSAGASSDGGASRGHERPSGGGASSSSGPRGSAAGAALPPLCRASRGVAVGRVRDPALDELSGLARSRRDPSVLFAEEDSGAPPVLTLMRTDASVVGHVTVTGATDGDWEDVATVRGPDGPLLYLLDNGPTGVRRTGVRLWRVPEPRPGDTATAPAVAIDAAYPDGAHDAEALLADPLRGDLVVVTKASGGGRAYGVPAAVARGPARAVTLSRGPAVVLGWVTAGDVSGDGRIVALRSYTTLAVWRRRGDEPLLRTLARPATCHAPAPLLFEGQGESLALDRTGAVALTAPEGASPLLRRYGG